MRSVAPPLWASDTFRWADADTKPDYDYSRTVNPNRDLLADALAELEGAAGGAITSIGPVGGAARAAAAAGRARTWSRRTIAMAAPTG